MEIESLTLLILCGGQGTRMQGQDKPLLGWRGQAMVDHVLHSVPRNMPKLISANRNLPAYADRAPVVSDADTPGAGPLVGVLAAMEICQTPWLLVAPGDAPELPPTWWQSLMEASAGINHAVLCDDSRQQHLHLLLNISSCKASLNAYLSSGNFSVHAWIDEIGVVQAKVPGQIRNLNYPADLNDSDQSSIV